MNFKFLIIVFLNSFIFSLQGSDDHQGLFHQQRKNVEQFQEALTSQDYSTALDIAKKMFSDFEFTFAEHHLSNRLKKLDEEDGIPNFTKEVDDNTDGKKVRDQIEGINIALIHQKNLWRVKRRSEQEQVEVIQDSSVSFVVPILRVFFGSKQ